MQRDTKIILVGAAGAAAVVGFVYLRHRTASSMGTSASAASSGGSVSTTSASSSTPPFTVKGSGNNKQVFYHSGSPVPEGEMPTGLTWGIGSQQGTTYGLEFSALGGPYARRNQVLMFFATPYRLDGTTKVPLANQKVYVKLSGPAGSGTVHATTNVNGIAQFWYPGPNTKLTQTGQVEAIATWLAPSGKWHTVTAYERIETEAQLFGS